MIKSKVNSNYLGQDLIFIISQPKAGSTLLQRLLAGHEEVQTSAETWLMLHPIYGLRSRGIKTDFNANWASTGVREFLDNYADGENTYREGIRNFAATVYGRVLEKSGKRLFLDKTPRYTMIVDELYELFPKAKYVLLIRNPLAILKSELHTYVKGDWPILSEFEPDLVGAPARLIAARNLLGNSAFEIMYEDLVSSPEDSVRKLCDFLGIQFDMAMLDYSNTPAPVGRMNDPVGIHRHTKPSTMSLDKWKELGADTQLRSFAFSYLDELGDETVRGLGYDPERLRTELNKQPVTSVVRFVYPWSLAIRPRERWGFRQRISHAYLMTAQKHGRLRGLFEAMKVVLARLGGGTTRFAGRRAK
jgi:hypothetical protein